MEQGLPARQEQLLIVKLIQTATDVDGTAVSQLRLLTRVRVSSTVPAMQKWRLSVAPRLGVECAELEKTFLWSDEAGLVISRIGKVGSDRFRLEFATDMAIDVVPSALVFCDSSKSALPSETARHLLEDQVLPRVIAHEGKLVLHAGGVRIDDGAILLLGGSGRGKSTLSASFNQAGCKLLGDDAMIISAFGGRHRVRPVYSSLRLLPDSVEALLPGSVTTSDVAHYSSKRRIDMPAHFEDNSTPVPIVAMFVIGQPSGDGRITTRRMTIAEACMMLVENSFALDPSDLTRAGCRLELASELSRDVPAYQICYPRDYARLPDVRRAILDQVGTLERP